MCLRFARLGLPVGGSLLIEVQVELLGRWALLGYQVGPLGGYSGVPAMSREAPARPLRLGLSMLSRRRRRSSGGFPTKAGRPVGRWRSASPLVADSLLVRLDHDFSLMIRQPVVPRTSGSIVSTAAQITHA